MRRLPVPLALLAVALLLAGCGGGDDDASETTTTAKEPTSTSSSEPGDTGRTTPTTADFSPDADPFCTELGRYATIRDQIDYTDMDSIRQGLEAQANVLAETIPTAPDEIAGSLSSLASGIDDLRGYATDAESVADFQTAAESTINDPDLQADDIAIQDWMGDNCPTTAGG